MKSARKTIRRTTEQSATRAMQAHINRMVAKGWTIDQEFAGASGFKHEIITYFTKA